MAPSDFLLASFVAFVGRRFHFWDAATTRAPVHNRRTNGLSIVFGRHANCIMRRVDSRDRVPWPRAIFVWPHACIVGLQYFRASLKLPAFRAPAR